jgi:hypothetical protein
VVLVDLGGGGMKKRFDVMFDPPQEWIDMVNETKNRASFGLTGPDYKPDYLTKDKYPIKANFEGPFNNKSQAETWIIVQCLGSTFKQEWYTIVEAVSDDKP